MSRIREDPRVVIDMELRKKLPTVRLGWEMSICYSFEITLPERRLITNDVISIPETFDMIENTYLLKKEKLNVPKFYKHIVDCILLKYIHQSTGKPEFNNFASTKCTACNIL